MSRIQREATSPPKPTEPPEPKKTARTNGAPPFTPAQAKSRQSATAQGTGTAPPQRQHARTVKQVRTAMQSASVDRQPAGLQERTREAAASELNAVPNASTRFDSGNGLLPVAFFDAFAETEGCIKKSDASATLESLLEAAALDEPLDCTALARLLPPGGNDGIFDVILPTGDRLGVVVSGRPSALSYLLSPSSDKFGSRLRRHKMELEERLEQLTHRNVNITVL